MHVTSFGQTGYSLSRHNQDRLDMHPTGILPTPYHRWVGPFPDNLFVLTSYTVARLIQVRF